MVRLTGVCGQMRTFGFKMKKNYNHRVPLRYQRFAEALNSEEIIEHYSRDDINELNPRQGERTYKDAQQTIGRKNFLLPNLSDQDLEINEIFQKEVDRQKAIIARINKIRVIVDSVPGKDTQLVMNKDLSTPYDCACHIHELVTSRSVVAEIFPYNTIDTSNSLQTTTSSDSTASSELSTTGTNKSENVNSSVDKQTTKSTFWDMHRPLPDDCRIKFRHFMDKDLGEINKIYWRSCSFVLGMAIRLAFKDEVKTLLHSWPRPDIKSGSFVYDVALNLSDKWTPVEQELRAFTKVMWDIKRAELPFDRLQVDRDIAQKMFSRNPLKLAQIDSIAANDSSQGKVTVYRCGGLLDISIGPMISNTNQIGRISLAAVHPFESDSDQYKGVFYRFQGVSLPQQLPVSSYLYQNILLNNAKKLNKVAL